jgi:hypothetical protein
MGYYYSGVSVIVITCLFQYYRAAFKHVNQRGKKNKPSLIHNKPHLTTVKPVQLATCINRDSS